MSTVTCSAMSREPSTAHTGAITVFGQTLGTISLTAASVIQFLKIPDRAKIIDGYCSRGNANGDVSVSLNGTVLFTASGAVAQPMTHAGRGLVISVTASDYPKYKVVTGTTASATITGTIKVSITYTMDHEDNTGGSA